MADSPEGTVAAPEPPRLTRELAEAFARAALSAIPVAGGAAIEALNFAVTRGRTARMQRWAEDITAAVNRHGLALEELSDRPGFLDTIGPATRAAVETASSVKIEALRNAVLNATMSPDLEADRHAVLMDILIALTPTHIKLLKLFDDPADWFTKAGIEPPRLYAGSQHAVVEIAYPHLAQDTTLLDRVVADLDREGLSSIALRTMMTGDGILSARTRPLGAELLTFITEPPH